MLTENSRAIGYINYSFSMGFVLLKELKKMLLGPKKINSLSWYGSAGTQ